MSKPLTFLSVIRLIDMIPRTGVKESTFAYYVSRFWDWLEENDYKKDAEILKEHLRIRNGEKVAMAVMDKAPDEYKKYYGAICDLCAEVDNHKKDCIIQIKDDVEVHTDKIYIENLNGNLYIN